MKIALRKSFTDKTSTVYILPDVASVEVALAMLWREVGPVNAPFFLKVNGKIWLRSSWENELPAQAFVEVYIAPGAGADLAVVSLVITIASLAFTAYMIANLPEAPNASTDSLPESENVFSFSGQKNTAKLNEIVETTFGTNKWFPPYFTLPRIYFVNNRAYIHLWFSLGKGLLEVDEVRVGDTLVDDIANSEWSFRSTGVPDETYDCVYIGDKTNTKLSAPDEEVFETVSMIVTPVGALSSVLQMNLTFVNGLNRTVKARWKYRKVDDLGRAITPWSSWVTESFTAASATQQRYTRLIEGLTPARYEVAVERVTASGSEQLNLISCYGLGFSGVGTPVQLLRVLLQGSNAIDESSASDISVVTTRKLETIRDGGWFYTETRTRNPVWAILDILVRSGIERSALDLPYWEALAKQVTQTFDYVYTNKSTAWQAIQDACSVFRGQMFVVGSDFRVAIDTPENTPVTFFGPDNATDMVWNIAFPQPQDEDAIEAVYVDPVTGLQSTVQFTPPGSYGTNPRTVTLTGVTDRTQAWRTAAYKWLSTSLLRDTVSFTAGMDGMIPMYGDLINVAWPFPAWAQAGLVNFQDDNGELVVTEDLDADGGPNWVSLRNTQGQLYGPVPCTVGSASNRITLDSPLPVGMFNFEDFTRESTMFTFGKSTTMEKVFRVTSLTPQDATVKVEAVAYDTAVFTYDVIEAPVNDRVPVSYPGISWSQVAIASSAFWRIVWPSVEGATSYTVKYAYLPNVSDNNAYILDPATYPLWTEAPEAEAFGTVAYLPVTSDSRIMVRITANTGEVAYWRGMSSGEPLVLTLGTGNVANAIRGTTGAVTFNASDIEMVYKVDPAIGGNCTVRYYVNDGVTISHIEVPVSDTGYAVISAEVLRRTGFAGKYGIVRVIYVHQGDTPEIVVPLTVNPITVPSGMDNYVVETLRVKTLDCKIKSTTMNVYETPYLKSRVNLQLIADAVGEYCSEWEFTETDLGIVKPTIVQTSQSRDFHIEVYNYAAYNVSAITVANYSGTDEATVTFEVPPEDEDSPSDIDHNNVCILLDGDVELLPTNSAKSFYLACISIPGGPDRWSLELTTDSLRSPIGSRLPSPQDIINLQAAKKLLFLKQTMPVSRIDELDFKTSVRARLIDYYGGATDWTTYLTVS